LADEEIFFSIEEISFQFVSATGNNVLQMVSHFMEMFLIAANADTAFNELLPRHRASFFKHEDASTLKGFVGDSGGSIPTLN